MSVASELDPPLRTGSLRRGPGRPPDNAAVAANAQHGMYSAAVTAAQHGDEDSFRLLYRAVQPHLLRYLRTLIGDNAEDIASETWLQITRDLRSFRGDFDAFRGWSVTIARNRALDHIRRHQRRPHEVMPVEELPGAADHGQDTAALAAESIATRQAVAMIAGLPREQAEAVMLRVVMGLDAATVGRILGKRPGAVRTAAHRGLRRLAEQLGTDPHQLPADPT